LLAQDEFSWDASIKIAKAISISSELFPDEKGFSLSFGFGSPKNQAAIFIYKLIKKHENSEDRFEISKELMSLAKQFDFAYELNKRFRSGDSPEQKLFSNKQYQEFASLLIQRSLDEANGLPLFVKNSDFHIIKYILGSWSETDKVGLDRYILSILEVEKNKVIDLLRAFTPTGVNSVDGEFRADFSKDIYNYFIILFDKELIKKLIFEIYSLEELLSEKVIWIDIGISKQTDLNIIRQFLHWYQAEQPTIELIPTAIEE
jgi:hypothetical protein